MWQTKSSTHIGPTHPVPALGAWNGRLVAGVCCQCLLHRAVLRGLNMAVVALNTGPAFSSFFGHFYPHRYNFYSLSKMLQKTPSGGGITFGRNLCSFSRFFQSFWSERLSPVSSLLAHAVRLHLFAESKQHLDAVKDCPEPT